MVMVLQRSYPNLGSASLEYAHCPNCSRMYKSIDEDGTSETLPDHCRRCGCPIDDNDVDRAKAWMNVQAEEQHDSALSDLARRGRVTQVEVTNDIEREYSDPEE